MGVALSIGARRSGLHPNSSEFFGPRYHEKSRLELDDGKRCGSQNPEMPQEALDTARSMQEKMSSPSILTAVQIIFALFIGFIVSLIGGLIVKKSRPE